MPLEPVLRDSLNKQITNERYNAAFYRAAAARLDLLNLPGFARWMKRSAKEETKHASWFADYLIDRNEAAIYAALDAVTLPNGSTINNVASALFALALQAEQRTTQQINSLYLMADEVNDPQTCVFLHWFIEEQTKSEREVTEILAQVKLAESDPAGILTLDHRLGKHG